jgi:hypothetical protein
MAIEPRKSIIEDLSNSFGINSKKGKNGDNKEISASTSKSLISIIRDFYSPYNPNEMDEKNSDFKNNSEVSNRYVTILNICGYTIIIAGLISISQLGKYASGGLGVILFISIVLSSITFFSLAHIIRIISVILKEIKK